METRDPEHFQVLHANTERFKHGPIIYAEPFEYRSQKKNEGQ